MDLAEIAQCPRCQGKISGFETAQLSCVNCGLEFRRTHNQPILIDFEKSVFDPNSYIEGGGVLTPRDITGRSLESLALQFVTGTNNVAVRNAQEFLTRLHTLSPHPRVLVIGGGAIGAGAESLYNNPDIDLVSTDVYASSNTCAVVDGHNIPFRDEAFDGVWIQAVLEHVLEPEIVAGEIFRVLKMQGLVYSEIPFMQQVHAGAYDFTRFTMSGHRWLFRRFDQIAAGTVGGAGTAFVWSVRYLCRSLSNSYTVGTLMSLLIFWARFLDPIARRRPNADAASGTFFLGTKLGHTLTPRDMVQYYEDQEKPIAAVNR